MDLWRSLVRKFSRSSRVTSANDDDDDDFRIATQAPLSSNQNQFVDVESLYVRNDNAATAHPAGRVGARAA